MTPKTLRQERIQKFKEILVSWWKASPYTMGVVFAEGGIEQEFTELAKSLADASISRSEIAGEYKTDEQKEAEAKVYNAPVFRGDWRDYPEHLHKIAECLRDTWMFDLPDKPKKKKSKSRYSFFIMSMESIKQSCGEFGVKALEETHKKWRAGFKNGLAPYTIATPQSLVNVVAGTAREMREIGNSGISPELPKGMNVAMNWLTNQGISNGD